MPLPVLNLRHSLNCGLQFWMAFSSRSSNGGKMEEGLIIMMNSLSKREPMDFQVLNT